MNVRGKIHDPQWLNRLWGSPHFSFSATMGSHLDSAFGVGWTVNLFDLDVHISFRMNIKNTQILQLLFNAIIMSKFHFVHYFGSRPKSAN